MALFGFMKRFEDEEALETWFSEEKDRLDESFSKAIIKDKDNIPEERAEYSKALDSLLTRYKGECNKFLDLRTRQGVEAREKKKHEADWKKFKEEHEAELKEFWEGLKKDFAEEKAVYVNSLQKLVKRYQLAYVKLKNRIFRRRRR